MNSKLDATDVLDSLSHIVKWVDETVPPATDASHYLIRYIHAKKEVNVVAHTAPIKAAQSYEEMELRGLRGDLEDENIVLVEVDKISKLREAYPNYFGDVQLFKKQLTDITMGKGAAEYTLPPRTIQRRPDRENPDLTWFRRPRFRKPKGA